MLNYFLHLALQYISFYLHRFIYTSLKKNRVKCIAVSLRFLMVSLLYIGFNTCLQAQVSMDSINKILKTMPSFSIYKENYFITGVPLDQAPTIENSDIKFQISFKQRLTNAVLPFKSYLFLTYTQKTFWDVYQKSSPFSDNNFNPSVGFGKFIYKQKKQIGIVNIQVEHESNGQDSSHTRSWNSISCSYMGYVQSNKMLIAKTWIPFSINDNRDLPEFIGYGELTFSWEMLKDKFLISATARKGAAWDVRGSFQTGIYFKPFKSLNEYIYLQIYNGYGENLINYSVLTNKIRLGICIRPSMLIF